MKIADRQARNKKVLEVFEEVLKENGIMLKFASKKNWHSYYDTQPVEKWLLLLKF